MVFVVLGALLTLFVMPLGLSAFLYLAYGATVLGAYRSPLLLPAMEFFGPLGFVLASALLVVAWVFWAYSILDANAAAVRFNAAWRTVTCLRCGNRLPAPGAACSA